MCRLKEKFDGVWLFIDETILTMAVIFGIRILRNGDEYNMSYKTMVVLLIITAVLLNGISRKLLYQTIVIKQADGSIIPDKLSIFEKISYSTKNITSGITLIIAIQELNRSAIPVFAKSESFVIIFVRFFEPLFIAVSLFILDRSMVSDSLIKNLNYT